MSSAIGSRRLKDLWDDFGVVYAGAQKNFGTSGLTFTIVREDILDRIPKSRQTQLPIMMDWNKQAATKDYFPNTPSMMAIYISELMCDHMINQGGIEYYEDLADRKS